jgi:hypothetical protein
LSQSYPQILQKKKKSFGEDGATTSTDSQSPDAAARRSATKRFNEAVTSLSSNSDDDLWVQLNNMYIDDAKAEKLCDALKKNTHVLSLDLTNNDLSDVGVIALCGALSTGAAPDLITLRLQDNAGITKEGINAIHELNKTRKSIKIETGVTPKPSSPSSKNTSSSGSSASTSAGTTGGLTKTSNNQSLGNSDFVRKYFQVGNDDDDEDDSGDGDGVNGGGGGEDGMMNGMDPEQLSALLWDKVSRRSLIMSFFFLFFFLFERERGREQRRESFYLFLKKKVPDDETS